MSTRACLDRDRLISLTLGRHIMHQPSPIELIANPPSLLDVDFESAFIEDKTAYEKKLKKLQKKMLEVQQAYYHQGKRAIIVMEGWDASGKGGSIRRLTEKLDPRGFTVHPIAAPTKEEQGTHYLFRFQQKLPAPGSICIFDRSYYGRVLVERIEGFADKPQWQRAYQEINEFERLLMDDGVRFIKLFLHIDKQEQLKRFAHRLHDPVKRWKLTEEDIRNHKRWDEYEVAINEMFAQTSTVNAPWQIIPARKKWYARIAVLEAVIESMSQNVDITPPPVDEAVVKAAEQHLGIVHKTGD